MNRVTLSPEPPGIFRFGLAPAGSAGRGVPPGSGHTCRLQGHIGARARRAPAGLPTLIRFEFDGFGEVGNCTVKVAFQSLRNAAIVVDKRIRLELRTR